MPVILNFGLNKPYAAGVTLDFGQPYHEIMVKNADLMLSDLMKESELLPPAAAKGSKGIKMLPLNPGVPTMGDMMKIKVNFTDPETWQSVALDIMAKQVAEDVDTFIMDSLPHGS